ncbi:MAG: sel1 repeat family protein, partial [Bacteroidaceae bacterium]|nr:sel1 repeat family protein [Bacteroidaceae bacterium]
GFGVLQDYSKAVELYERSAIQGDAYAQMCLGICYENGCGVFRDYSKAVEWYEKSAAQGNASVLRALERCKKYKKD